MRNKSPYISIIDVGSNTIKLLTAIRGNPIHIIEDKTYETRIIQHSYNINKYISQKSIKDACRSIHQLVQLAQKYDPKNITIVGTSAIRDAKNLDFFKEKVLKCTGYHLQELSKEEEALTVCQAAIQDPLLANINSFYLLDLGGGSLELIEYYEKSINQLVSIPIGVVRVAHKYFGDKDIILNKSIAIKINHFIEERIQTSGFSIENKNQPLVITSGSLAVAGEIIFKQNPNLNNNQRRISVNILRELYANISGLNITQRLKLPGMSTSHADILPIALLIFIFFAEKIDVNWVLHTKYNLRFGLATKSLSKII